MGNCCQTKDTWMAKESYFPDQDHKIDKSYVLLQFDLNDKLKMLDDQIQKVSNFHEKYLINVS